MKKEKLIQHLGGQSRKLDLRDIKLGKVQSSITIPEKYITDISWLKVLYQNGIPACGSHAGSHLKMILDYFDVGKTRYSPEYLWIKIKEIDEYALESGTDMRSIFKILKNTGICDYSLLPNNFPMSLDDYSDKNKITPIMNKNAQPRIIKSYAFSNPSQIKQDIFQNKAILALINVNTAGTNWFKNNKPIFNSKNVSSGHFVCAYGYSKDSIFIIDSADLDVPFKELNMTYPIRETGTAVDLPDEVIKEQVQKIAFLQQIVALYYKLIKIKNDLLKLKITK